MAREKPKPKPNETAHEEFARRIQELYELANKMGLYLTISYRTKAGLPAEAASPRRREPGEN